MDFDNWRDWEHEEEEGKEEFDKYADVSGDLVQILMRLFPPKSFV